MPHLVIEYSPSLDEILDFQIVAEAARAAAAETGVFPIGGIRARTHRCAHAAVADGEPTRAFVDCTLKMGKGRDEATKKRVGEHVFNALSKALDPAFAATAVGLSLEIREIDELNWKRNTLHDAINRT